MAYALAGVSLLAAALHTTVPSTCPPPPKIHVSRIAPVMSAVATDPAATGQAVAAWCVSAGRDQATIAVSTSTNLAGVMKDFWSVARNFAEEGGAMGRQRALAFPCWEAGMDPILFQKTLQHIMDCAEEICEYVGEEMLISARHPLSASMADEPGQVPCPMLLLRSFTQAAWGDYGEENYGEADPFAMLGDDANNPINARPDLMASDAEVIEDTRKWVEGIIVKMKVRAHASPRPPESLSPAQAERARAFFESVPPLTPRCARACAHWRAGLPLLGDGGQGRPAHRRSELPDLACAHG